MAAVLFATIATDEQQPCCLVAIIELKANASARKTCSFFVWLGELTLRRQRQCGSDCCRPLRTRHRWKGNHTISRSTRIMALF
jgi:hypothetical protein